MPRRERRARRRRLLAIKRNVRRADWAIQRRAFDDAFNAAFFELLIYTALDAMESKLLAARGLLH